MQPGQYHLQDTIKVNKAGAIIYGMGLVTLISEAGNPCIEVAHVDGVRISGILLQAGPNKSEALLKWGDGYFAGNPEDPGFLYDIFARVGGTNADGNMQTEFMV